MRRADEDVFLEMVRFIYTRQLQVSDSNVVRLLLLADQVHVMNAQTNLTSLQFQLPNVMNEVIRKLEADGLTLETSSRLLEASDALAVLPTCRPLLSVSLPASSHASPIIAARRRRNSSWKRSSTSSMRCGTRTS